MSEYFWVLIFSISIPLIYSFSDNWGFAGNYKYALISIVLASLPFILWDIIVTDIGHWSFNKEFTSGFYIINLPVEEVLFFLVIPFCCTFTWNALNRYWGDERAD